MSRRRKRSGHCGLQARHVVMPPTPNAQTPTPVMPTEAVIQTMIRQGPFAVVLPVTVIFLQPVVVSGRVSTMAINLLAHLAGISPRMPVLTLTAVMVLEPVILITHQVRPYVPPLRGPAKWTQLVTEMAPARQLFINRQATPAGRVAKYAMRLVSVSNRNGGILV